MLVLGVRQGEAVIIETLQGPVRIELLRSPPGQRLRRLAFKADKRIRIWREEIYTRRKEAGL